MKNSLIVIIALVVVVVAVLLIMNTGTPTSRAVSGLANAGVPNAGMLILLSEVSSNARWYEYDSNGATIRFFAVKASDGSIKTAFDACDVCYGAKKGYRQEGNMMVCNNCGKKFSIDGLGTENRGTGCWPGYLPNTIQDGKIVIRKADIEGGRWRFA